MLLTQTLKLSASDRVRAVETNKSYALTWFKKIYFFPKSQCKMYEIDDWYYRWIIEIPTWLIDKNDEIREIFNLIKERNDENRDTGFSYN